MTPEMLDAIHAGGLLLGYMFILVVFAVALYIRLGEDDDALVFVLMGAALWPLGFTIWAAIELGLKIGNRMRNV